MLTTVITHEALVVLLQLLAFILLSLAAASVPWLYAHIKSRALAEALAWLINVAAIAVGAGAGAVRDLKDPTKPGSWSPEAATRFRAAAVGSVMQMGRGALEVVSRGQGLTAAGREQLVEQLVEAAVEQSRRGSLVLPVPVPSVLRGPTVSARVPTSAPMPRTVAARGQEGRAAFGAIVLLSLGAVACSGGALAAAGAAADTASSVILVARKVRAALCAEQLDPYLGAVRERVVVVHDGPVDGGAAADAATSE